MKKLLITLTVLSVLFVSAVVSVSVWQNKNIKSILLGVKEDSKEIEHKRNENQSKLVDDINEYLDMPVRELTEEEKQKIEKGEITITDVYMQIFKEKLELQGTESRKPETKKPETQPPETQKPETQKPELQNPESKKPENSKPESQKPEKLTDKDAVISYYMTELYKLQNEYTARAETTISQGASYYESLKKHPQDAEARAQTIKHFTPIVRGIESECDEKINMLMKNMENELKKIGADTSIVSTVRTAYENEKQLKMSYYANKYLT